MTGDRGVPVTGVIEITLEQGDLAAAEEFYSVVLGFPVVERWADETVWVMAADRTRIGLWRPQIGLGGGRGGVAAVVCSRFFSTSKTSMCCGFAPTAMTTAGSPFPAFMTA